MSQPAPARDEDFDPYYKWLGIPQHQRPPTIYQLLGISSDELDPEVISAATDRQRAYVSQFRGGPFDKHAASLLYQLDEARAVLLNPASRNNYDSKLGLSHKRKPVDRAAPGAPLQGDGSSRTVGEESGISRQFLGIVATILAGFIIMAVVSSRLPWSKWMAGGSTTVSQPPAAEPARNIAQQPGAGDRHPANPPGDAAGVGNDAAQPPVKIANASGADGRPPVKSNPRVADQSGTPQPEVVVLKELPSGAAHSAPWPSSDGMTLYFVSVLPDEKKPWIWSARRKNKYSPFENFERHLPGMDPTVSSDGLQMIFKDDKVLAAATRNSTHETFRQAEKIKEFEDVGILAAPSLSADGLTLYADRWPPGTTNFGMTPSELVQFKRATRAATWSSPKTFNFAGIHPWLVGRMRFLSVTADQLHAFAMFRGADPTTNRVLMSSRNSTSDPFGAPVVVSVAGERRFSQFPRYVATTGELFCMRSEKGKSEIVVIRNFDFPVATAPLEKSNGPASREPQVAGAEPFPLDRLKPSHCRVKKIEKGIQVTFLPHDYPGLTAKFQQSRNWDGFTSLVLDVENPGSKPVTFFVRLDDDPNPDGRHNGPHAGGTIGPGVTATFEVPFVWDGSVEKLHETPNQPGTRPMLLDRTGSFDRRHIHNVLLFVPKVPAPLDLAFRNVRLIRRPALK